jgi:hypothetical protein
MPVGVVEKRNIGQLLSEQTERDATFRAATATRLSAIEHQLAHILEELQRLNSGKNEGQSQEPRA